MNNKEALRLIIENNQKNKEKYENKMLNQNKKVMITNLNLKNT